MSAGLKDLRQTTKRARAKPPLAINVAFMLEVKEASEELWQLLREITDLCSHPLSIRLRPKRSVELLVRLQDQLGLYFTLEEYYGYFESPALVDRRVSERASELRAQHQAMYLDICAIVDRAERLLDQRRIATLTQHITIRVDAFYEQFLAHEVDEQNLLLHADGETI